jgi:hypothetical protein
MKIKASNITKKSKDIWSIQVIIISVVTLLIMLLPLKIKKTKEKDLIV